MFTNNFTVITMHQAKVTGINSTKYRSNTLLTKFWANSRSTTPKMFFLNEIKGAGGRKKSYNPWSLSRRPNQSHLIFSSPKRPLMPVQKKQLGCIKNAILSRLYTFSNSLNLNPIEPTRCQFTRQINPQV